MNILNASEYILKNNNQFCYVNIFYHKFLKNQQKYY